MSSSKNAPDEPAVSERRVGEIPLHPFPTEDRAGGAGIVQASAAEPNPPEPIVLHGFDPTPATGLRSPGGDGDEAGAFADPRYQVAFAAVMLVLLVAAGALWQVWHEPQGARGPQMASRNVAAEPATTGTPLASQQLPPSSAPADTKRGAASPVLAEPLLPTSPVAAHKSEAVRVVTTAHLPVRTLRSPGEPGNGAELLAPAIAVAFSTAGDRLEALMTSRAPLPAIAPGTAPVAAPSTASSRGAQAISRLLEQPAQSQAEGLLQAALDGNSAAITTIEAQVSGWRGKLKWSPRLAQLDLAARGSPDPALRVVTMDVMLAAYNYAKQPKTVDQLVRLARDQRPARPHVMDALARLGNRGVEPARVTQVLERYAYDPDPNTQLWAIEGLSMLGTRESIPILSRLAAEGTTATQRERAARGLTRAQKWVNTGGGDRAYGEVR